MINAERYLIFLSNAPVQARWANAQRAGPAPSNPPTVACNRLLGRYAPRITRLPLDVIMNTFVPSYPTTIGPASTVRHHETNSNALGMPEFRPHLTELAFESNGA